ncbi:MerR family transcriptional regulator [bacterium]|nr:MerR family transcriptional regulator [bacterium]
MDGPKIKRLYYSTRDVSEKAGIDTQLLRSWEKKFSFLKPIKSKTGRRLYKPSDLNLVIKIIDFKKNGLTDDRIEFLLKQGTEAVEKVDKSYDYSKERELPVHEIIATLQEIVRILDSRDS